MAVSTIAKNFRDGRVTVKDGTSPTPLDVVIAMEDGNFQFDGMGAQLYDIAKYEDRGELYSVRKTKRRYPTFSVSAHMTEFSDATNENILDLIMQAGSFAAAVSTLGTSADVYTLLVLLEVEGSDFGDSTDHTATFDDCVVQIGFAEGDPNQFTISGEILGSITFV